LACAILLTVGVTSPSSLHEPNANVQCTHKIHSPFHEFLVMVCAPHGHGGYSSSLACAIILTVGVTSPSSLHGPNANIQYTHKIHSPFHEFLVIMCKHTKPQLTPHLPCARAYSFAYELCCHRREGGLGDSLIKADHTLPARIASPDGCALGRSPR
jgi:hypothetical protein